MTVRGAENCIVGVAKCLFGGDDKSTIVGPVFFIANISVTPNTRVGGKVVFLYGLQCAVVIVLHKTKINKIKYKYT